MYLEGRGVRYLPMVYEVCSTEYVDLVLCGVWVQVHGVYGCVLWMSVLSHADRKLCRPSAVGTSR
jgi:hypothetical protein